MATQGQRVEAQKNKVTSQCKNEQQDSIAQNEDGDDDDDDDVVEMFAHCAKAIAICIQMKLYLNLHQLAINLFTFVYLCLKNSQ